MHLLQLLVDKSSDSILVHGYSFQQLYIVSGLSMSTVNELGDTCIFIEHAYKELGLANLTYIPTARGLQFMELPGLSWKYCTQNIHSVTFETTQFTCICELCSTPGQVFSATNLKPMKSTYHDTSTNLFRPKNWES